VDSLRKLTKYLTQGRIPDNFATQIETIPLFCQNSSVTTEKLSAFVVGVWDFPLLQKVQISCGVQPAAVQLESNRRVFS